LHLPQFYLDAWYLGKSVVAPHLHFYQSQLHQSLFCSQVPQFILEDAWYRGKGCRVVCTQPRRISAVSGATLRDEIQSLEAGVYVLGGLQWEKGVRRLKGVQPRLNS